MASRVAWLTRVGLVLVVAGGAALFWARDVAPDEPPADAAQPAADDGEPLPVPPLPPRIADGDQYDRCLALLPSDPEGAQEMAESWSTAGGGDAAEHCLAQARVALGDPDDGATMLEEVAGRLKGNGAERAAVYDQAAQAWLVAGEPARAFAAASHAVELTPEMPDLRVDRAMAAEQLGRWAEAVDDLTQALAAEPRRPDALVLRSTAQRHLGQIDLAQADIDAALALDPGDSEALLERGILKQHRDDIEGARADWQRAIDLAPDSQAADLAQQNLALLEAGPKQR
jgi:tetratricopeptide (TPR) repeat protein